MFDALFRGLSGDDLKMVMFNLSLVPTKFIKIPHKLSPKFLSNFLLTTYLFLETNIRLSIDSLNRKYCNITSVSFSKYQFSAFLYF